MPRKLAFAKFGNPAEELAIMDDVVPEKLEPGQAHVRVLLAPVNPADFISIMGLFPMKPPLPAVPGMEAVVEVVRTQGDSALKPGDRAVLNTLVATQGVWRQEFVIAEKFLYKVPPHLPLEAAATLIINPATAHLLVNSIVKLEPGDCLIQNAANSVVGQVVIQLAHAAGIKTINVVRDRANFAETESMLKDLGADFVITSSQLAQGLEKLNLQVAPPRLGIDCVSGKAALDMSGALGFGATFVVCGTLSGEPLSIDPMALIMKNVTIVGFTLFSWMDREETAEAFSKILQQLVELYTSGKLRLPAVQKFSMDDWKDAVEFASRGYTNTKVLLQFN